MLKSAFLNRRQPASVFLAVMSLLIFGFLIAISYSVAQLKISQLEESVNKTIPLKLKLVNASALNEVMASRLFPSSNRLSWQFDSEEQITTDSDPVDTPQPFFFPSGYVYEKMEGVRKVVGRYQYIVIGANPFMNYDSGTGTYSLSTTKVNEGVFLYNIENPIYVGVRSFVCADKETKAIAYDAIEGSSTGPDYAQCASSTQKLYSETHLVQLEPEGLSNESIRFKVVSSQSIEPDTAIALGSSLLQRDGTSSDTLHFNDWWNNTGTHAYSKGFAVPIAYRYRKADGTYVVANWPTNTTTQTLPSTAMILNVQIIFRGAMDERSLYVADHPTEGAIYNYRSQIAMNVLESKYPPYTQDEFSGLVFKKNTSIDSGKISQTLQYPGGNSLFVQGTVPCNTSNRLILNDKGELRDADGFRNTTAYTLKFTTPPC
jgi:hypothetical protein